MSSKIVFLNAVKNARDPEIQAANEARYQALYGLIAAVGAFNRAEEAGASAEQLQELEAAIQDAEFDFGGAWAELVATVFQKSPPACCEHIAEHMKDCAVTWDANNGGSHG
jgi:hypothetical protein